MAGGIKLQWRDRNFAENGHRIYRSNTTMSLSNMPTPIATVDKNITEYIDYDVVEGNTYYYRIGAVRGSDEAISDEIELLAVEIDELDIFGDNSAISLFKFDGDTTDSITGAFGTWSGTEQYVSGINGQAVKFDGSSVFSIGGYDYGTLFDHNSLFSISFWVVERLLSFSFINSQGNTGFSFTDFSDGTEAHFLGVSTETGEAGSWYRQLNIFSEFVAGDHVVFNKISNTEVELYVNGVYTRLYVCTQIGTGNTTDNYFGQWIGITDPSNRVIAKGAMDHFRIFNRSLTSSEAYTLFTEFNQ